MILADCNGAEKWVPETSGQLRLAAEPGLCLSQTGTGAGKVRERKKRKICRRIAELKK